MSVLFRFGDPSAHLPAQSAPRFGFGFAFAAKAVWELAHKRQGTRIFAAGENPSAKHKQKAPNR